MLNKQSDNIQTCHTPFPSLNQPIVLCPVLMATPWSTYRFLRRQVRWSGIPISWGIFQFVVIQTVKGFSVINESEDVCLEFPCFLHDPKNVGNLIFVSSASSKLSMYIWTFLAHELLKSTLKDFEHNLASMWNAYKCTVVWTLFGIALLWNWNENWPFPVLWPLLSFPNLLTYWMQHFIASPFRIWNTSYVVN